MKLEKDVSFIIFKAVRRFKVFSSKQTRSDTRPIPFADGWAGAEMRVFPLFDSITTDQPTNRPTDQPTNGRTKRGIESRARN